MPREEDPLRLYLREVAQTPLLSAAEEIELARVARNDDDRGAAAKRRLVESNLRLVVSIAKGYARKGLSLLGVIQEGNLGLLRAIDKFDPDSGSKFSNSATTEIQRAIRDSIDKSQSG